MANRHTRAFQAHCHDQVHRGLINRADGSWKLATPDRSDVSMQAGYRLDGRLKRPKKEKKVAG